MLEWHKLEAFLTHAWLLSMTWFTTAAAGGSSAAILSIPRDGRVHRRLARSRASLRCRR
jgi:hypothetical protein